MIGEPPAVSNAQVEAVCLPGQGAKTCRYLVAGHRGFECAKNSHLRWTLDQRVEKGTMHARGDNCIGIVPPWTPLTGRRGTWREEGDVCPIKVVADNTDVEGVKLRVLIEDGAEKGREFDGFCAWEAGRLHALWTLTLDDGTVVR